ncbi:hypothetical protein FRC19_004429, partial [Serendipita sp. 401]
ERICPGLIRGGQPHVHFKRRSSFLAETKKFKGKPHLSPQVPINNTLTLTRNGFWMRLSTVTE